MLKISFLSSLFLVLFISSGIQIIAESNEDFIVNKIDHKVDFPNNISFIFEGFSEKKISDIKVNFKTGDRKALQYGYMDFNTDEELSLIHI